MSHPAQEQQDSAADFSQAPLQQQPNGHLAAGDPDRLAGRAVAVKAEPVAVKREAFPQPAQASDAQPAQQLPPTFAKGEGLPNGHFREDPAAQAVQSSSFPGHSQAQYEQQQAASQPEGLPGQPGQEGEFPGKQVSTGDIQRVQNYIERCLQLYLSQKEVITQLEQQFRIEPCFTQLVWQKLEEQNQEFFKAYYTRLKLKDQIILFNHLLDEQVKMFQRMPRGAQGPSGMSTLQPRPGMAPGFQPAVGQHAPPQGPSPPGAAGPLSQQPAVTAGYQMHGEVASQPPSLTADPASLSMGEFPGMDLIMPPDLTTIGQSLPFSGSELNLVSFGSPGRGPLGGGAGDHIDLSGLPRNFSLSDLALDQVNEGDASLARNISLSDLPALDLDSGGEQA